MRYNDFDTLVDSILNHNSISAGKYELIVKTKQLIDTRISELLQQSHRDEVKKELMYLCIEKCKLDYTN